MNLIILLVFIIILIIVYFFYKKENFDNLDNDILLSKPDETIKVIEVNEPTDNSIIPKNIFMTWYKKNYQKKCNYRLI